MTRSRIRRGWRLAVAGVVIAACGAHSVAAPAPSAAPPSSASASVSVDAGRVLGTLEPRLFGANIDFNWNANGLLQENGEPFPQLLTAATALGIPQLRGPGGSYADSYDWKKGTGPDRHGYGKEYGFGTPEFLSLLQRLGADGILTANFGTGDPALLRAWVQDVTAAKGRVSTWEIGNEIYGDWEKGHTDAADYAKRFLGFASAARSAAPDAKLALVLAPTMKGGGQDYDGWNETVLAAAGSSANVASVHLYSPWHDLFGSASRNTSLAVMAAPEYWARELGRLRTALAGATGADGKPLALWVTEWNTQHGSDHDWKQRNVGVEEMVFAADMLRVFAEQGVQAAQFYNLFGPYWGLFDRRGATDDLRAMLRLSFPPRRKPEDFQLVIRPAAHVFDLYRPLRGGARVAATSQSPTFSTQKYGSVPAQDAVSSLSTLAVKEEGGALSIVLINRSLDTRLDTRVTVSGFGGNRGAELLVMGGSALSDDNEDGVQRVRPQAAPVQADGDAWILQLPPASVSRLRLGPPEGGALVLQ